MWQGGFRPGRTAGINGGREAVRRVRGLVDNPDNQGVWGEKEEEMLVTELKRQRRQSGMNDPDGRAKRIEDGPPVLSMTRGSYK